MSSEGSPNIDTPYFPTVSIKALFHDPANSAACPHESNPLLNKIEATAIFTSFSFISSGRFIVKVFILSNLQFSNEFRSFRCRRILPFHFLL